MREVTPEPALPAEATAVRDLVRSAYAPYVPRMGWEPGPMSADYEEAIADGVVDVVRDAGGLAAVVVTRGGDDHLLIENIAVDPGRQGQGLGRALLAWAEAQATARGPGIRGWGVSGRGGGTR
jgi:GNAT superfamily N-acetyltransferase